jgi:hypothetical protein
MPKNTLTTTVLFHGNDVQGILETHPDVYKAVWEACSGLANATVHVDVAPRDESNDQLEWSMSIASPTGRRSLNISQRTPTAGIFLIPFN